MQTYRESVAEQIAQAQGLVNRGKRQRDLLDNTILQIFLPYAGLLALGVAMWWTGGPFPNAEAHEFISTAGFWFGAGMLALSVLQWLEHRRKAKQDDRAFTVWERIELAKARIVPEPEPRVPFPPVSFVEFLFANLTADGEFPTVDVCEAKGKFARYLVEDWFKQIDAAGAIEGRTPKKKAGHPAPGWDKARYLAAAQDAATL